MASDKSGTNATQVTTSRSSAWFAKTGVASALAVMAVMALLALLLAFQQVVSAGVRQAGERRLATAALTEQAWRCQALLDAAQRQGCPVPSLAEVGDLGNAPADNDTPVAALARLE